MAGGGRGEPSRGMWCHHLVRLDSAWDDFSLLHFLSEVLGLLFESTLPFNFGHWDCFTLGAGHYEVENKKGVGLRLDGKGGPGKGFAECRHLAHLQTTKDCHIAVIENTESHKSALSILKRSSDCWKYTAQK